MSDRGLQRATAIGASWSLIIRASGMFVAFGVQTLLARKLGQHGYGRYVYVLGWMNIAMLFAKLEFDTLALRFIGSYAGLQKWGMLNGFLRKTQFLTLALSAGTSLLAAAVLVIARPYVNPRLFLAGMWACALLLPTALLTVQGGFLQGFQRMVAAQAPQQVIRPVAFLALLSAFIWRLGPDVRAWHAVLANLMATLIALGISNHYLNKSTPIRALAADPEFDMPLWMKTAGGLMVIAGAQLVIGMQSDVVIVGSMLGTHVAALYSTASQVATLVSFGAVAITAIFIPQLAALYFKRDMRGLQHLLQIMLLSAAGMTLPVLLGVIVLGHQLLGLFGEAYTVGYRVMFVLSFSQAAAAIVGVTGGYLLTMTGHEREAAKIIVGSSILNFLLSIILTRWIGMTGTALATYAATVVRSAWLYSFAKKELGLNLLPLKWWKAA
ncbi:MAG: oligosaccharide flippase family protein [bacterium]